MTISYTFPFSPTISPLNHIFQQLMLKRDFEKPLNPLLAYRAIAEKELFPGRIGQTITMTRVGYLTPNTVRLDPSVNTGLNNGLTVQTPQQEQYFASIGQYPQLANTVNLLDNEAMIASLLLKNASNLGMAIGQTINRVAQYNLFSAYMGGNTRITASAGPTTTVAVDDLRGFMTLLVNGIITPVSVGNPLTIYINNVANTVTGFAIDGTNTSSAKDLGNPYSGTGPIPEGVGGISGTLTLGTSTTVVVGDAVIAGNAPTIVRPNGRSTTAGLFSTDKFSLEQVLAAKQTLVNNGVPQVDGFYHCYLSDTSMSQLFLDSRFDLLTSTRGTGDKNWSAGWIDTVLGVRFIPTTEAFVQTNISGITAVQRPIICGQGALIEEQFNVGLDAIRTLAMTNGVASLEQGGLLAVDDATGAYMYLRKPLDVTGQNVDQSANWVGGYAVPTDSTTTPAIVRTCNNADFKRAVIIETA